VDDLLEGILRLSRSDEHLPVNIGNPVEFTVLEAAQAILEVTGSRSEMCLRALPVDDPSRRCPDISKARALLGWEPRITLKEGLQKSLEFFRSKVAVTA
jgi:dTDP-glucose 4,6-dehydratase